MEADQKEMEENENKISSIQRLDADVKKSSGLSTKLKILKDFDAITEEDLSGAEDIFDDEINFNGTTLEVRNSNTDNVLEDNIAANKEMHLIEELDLPVKFPPDLTVVKEIVQSETPAKRKRGRPRKNTLACNVLKPINVTIVGDNESNSENIFPCSLCERTFSTLIGCKRHESACRRHSAKLETKILPEIEISPEVPEDPQQGGVIRRRRGRTPKSQSTLNEDILSTMDIKFKCVLCSKDFNTLPGCRRHEAVCPRLNNAGGGNDSDGYIPNVPIYNKQLNNLNEAFDGGLSGAPEEMESVDMKDPYIFEEGRCHCCGEDIETAHMGGEFECVDCKKLFRLKSSLERHRRVVHNEGETYQCPECDARCPDKGTLARHMYTHTGLKPVSCPVCNTQFSRKYHLIRHNFQTGCDGSKRPNFPCQVCGRIFNRKDNLREHLRAHAGQTKRKKKYTCTECNKEFVGMSLLALHKRTHIPGILEENGPNQMEGQTTEGQTSASLLYIQGDKPFGCDFCPKRFPSHGALKKHRRKHTGERPFECSYCFARFAAKETLNRHIRTHTGMKPHTCQYCGKGFIQASQLRAHVFHHSDVAGGSIGEGGFQCDQCDQAFNRKQRLLLHIKYVHEGAEPFKCENCVRTFLRREDLARHQLLHSGVKEHKCPICEKAFAMKSSLKIHLLTHTKEPPRSCDECGRAFIRQDCLLRHMRTKHRDMLEEIMAEAEKKKLQQQLLAAANQAALELPSEEPHVLNENNLADSIRELLQLLVDETTLKAFGWPDASVDKLLEAVIRRCGHQAAGFPDMAYADRLRENAKLLFTVVIDDSAVKTLLNNQTVDEVILHVLRLAKS